MTCIIGLVQDGRVYMGGDSAAVGGWDIQLTRRRKVFRVGPFLIGTAGSIRMTQILQHCLRVAEQGEESDDAFMVKAFVGATRNCLKEGGYTKIENSREEGGDFLVGYQGRLYKMQSDFQIDSYLDDFAALGSGEDYALGVMAVTSRVAPVKRITEALEVAAHFSIAVRAPFYVEELP